MSTFPYQRPAPTVLADGRNVWPTSEGGRIGHCDCRMAPCSTLNTCWGHEMPEEVAA